MASKRAGLNALVRDRILSAENESIFAVGLTLLPKVTLSLI